MNRTELKNAICQYFTECGQPRAMLPKIIEAIKKATNAQTIDADFPQSLDRKTTRYMQAAGLGMGDEFYWAISKNFDVKHYHTVAGFVKAYEEILEVEAEEEYKLEQAIMEEIGDLQGELAQWDENLYDEMGGSSAAIVIYPQYIEVRAYENGWGSRLPKAGRKYVGSREDIRWQYPLSAIDSLKALNLPTVQAQNKC